MHFITLPILSKHNGFNKATALVLVTQSNKQDNVKMPDGETPQGETKPSTQTEAVATPASSSSSQASGSVGNEGAQTSREDATALAAEVEALRKEKQKLEMERNLQRNRAEEEERKRLEEQEEYKTLWEKDRAKIEEIERTNSEKRLESFRKSIIDSYPDEDVRKAAQALIDKNPQNFVWTEGATEAEAMDDLKGQLDALAGVVHKDTPSPKVDPLNPRPSEQDANRNPQFAEKSVSDMEAELEKKLKGAGL